MLEIKKKSKEESLQSGRNLPTCKREREPLKYDILVDNWCEINKLRGKRKSQSFT
jgi:hypothetical protein